MFVQVYIVQCVSTGEFLSHALNYTKRVGSAGYFFNIESARETAINELDFDFELFSFYVKESNLPSYYGGVAFSPPPCNTGGTG